MRLPRLGHETLCDNERREGYPAAWTGCRRPGAAGSAAPPPPDFAAAEAFVWQASPEAFLPVPHVNRQPLGLLKGIDRAAEQLLDNTRRFARGLPANNALLWGARGMGKSSLVKAAHAEVCSERQQGARASPS